MKPTIKAVLFDVGGTLMETREPVGHVYASVAREFGLLSQPEKMHQLFKESFIAREKKGPLVSVSFEQSWWKDLVKDLIKQFGIIKDFDGYFNKLWQYYGSLDAWKIYPETEQVLTRLKSQGIRCAIVSNWDSRLPGLLDASNLSCFFEAQIISAICGKAKPDPGIFSYALQKLSLKSSEVLHVGDSVHFDWNGAQSIGLKALIVDRKNRDRSSLVTYADTLSGIFEHI
jgi:putative hydrolase of the HAD superfamily